ncbi:MAG: hypothetical protein EOP06_09895 [Proteobacteria bacterium]|nr:MAG: hypothetical protein EOP06_09895 [Pseudomonadota bacterium]
MSKPSNPQNLNHLVQVIQQTKVDYTRLAKLRGADTFEREASYAYQILLSNDFLADVAAGNPDSLKFAILDVASVGLTLNPLNPEVYLVPRKVNGRMRVMADIGYKGYVNLAIEAGSIVWAQAELVRERDTFKVNAAGIAPTHDFDAFKERGDVVGVYCVARVHNGDFITSHMPIGDVEKIAERSEAFKKKVGPWFTDWEEMVKKTMIRRGRKSWPSKQSAQLTAALKIDAAANPPLEITETEQAPDDQRSHSFSVIRELVSDAGKTEAGFVQALNSMCKRKIEKLEDLTDIEITKSITFLKGLPKAKQVTA